MYLSFGFAWVIAQYDVSGRATRRGVPNRPQLTDWMIGSIPLLLVVGLFMLPGAGAQWSANQGALAQTKAELSGFRFPLTLIQDEIRREPHTKLGPSVELYRTALAVDPNNVTALRRLAQIELSQGDVDNALQNLERAYYNAPGERATRQMLGEAYAVKGRFDEAAALWSSIGVAKDLLKNRLWWYEHLGDTQSASNIRAVLARLGM